MKNSASIWYTASIVAAGVAFMAMALIAYVTGNNSLIFIGMGIFMAVTLSLTSVMAQRQQRERKLAAK